MSPPTKDELKVSVPFIFILPFSLLLLLRLLLPPHSSLSSMGLSPSPRSSLTLPPQGYEREAGAREELRLYRHGHQRDGGGEEPTQKARTLSPLLFPSFHSPFSFRGSLFRLLFLSLAHCVRVV